MGQDTSDHRVRSTEALQELYGAAVERSLTKELDHINAEYRRFAEASPFFSLATVGPGGLDCSPRGDSGTAVHIVDEHTVHIPDRRGNNRLDSLANIVVDGRVALLFLVPGVTESLRINGTAELTTDPALCARYAVDGREPRSVIVVSVAAVYFQCARAIKRAGLWDADNHRDPADLPTAGQMSKAAAPDGFDAETYDAELAERQARTLY